MMCCGLVLSVYIEGGGKKEVGSVNAFTGQHERINSMIMARLNPENKNNICRSSKQQEKENKVVRRHDAGTRG